MKPRVFMRSMAITMAVATLAFCAWWIRQGVARPLVGVPEPATALPAPAASGSVMHQPGVVERAEGNISERASGTTERKEGRRLMVRVLRDDATGLPSVPILLTKQGLGVVSYGMTNARGDWDVMLDGDGRFVAETSCGDGQVEVRGAGEFLLTVVASRLQTVCGTVVDDQGQGVPGVDVVLGPNDDGSGMQRVVGTDAAGKFCLSVARAGCVLMARCKGRVDGPMVEAVDGVVVRLGDPASVCSLRIVDEKGAAVPATVLVGRSSAIRVLNPKIGVFEKWPMGREWRTGADGRVVIDGLSGFNRDLQVLPDSDLFARWRGSWQGAVDQQVVVSRSASLSGVVWSATGNPVVGARVALGDARDWRRAVTFTDGEGRFELRMREVGAVVLKASHEEHGSGDVELAYAGGRDQRIAVVLGDRRTVRLTNAEGLPIADAVVRLASKGREILHLTDGSGEILVPSAWWAELAVEWQASDGSWHRTEAVTASGSLLVVRDAGRN